MVRSVNVLNIIWLNYYNMSECQNIYVMYWILFGWITANYVTHRAEISSWRLATLASQGIREWCEKRVNKSCKKKRNLILVYLHMFFPKNQGFKKTCLIYFRPINIPYAFPEWPYSSIFHMFCVVIWKW